MADETPRICSGSLKEFLSYFAASAVALVIDYATYWTLSQSHLMELADAAAIGYSTGLAVAYFLIAGKVFSDGWLKERRAKEILLFALSGMLGIVLTYVSVAIYVSTIGESAHGAKLFSVILSFVVVYLFRKLIVFRKII